MKLSEFSKSAPPVSPGVSPSSPQEPENASLEAPQEEQYDPGRKGRQPLRKSVSTVALIEAYKGGMSLTEMESVYGISRAGIKKRFANAGFEILPPEITKVHKGEDNGRWTDDPSNNTAYQRARKMFPNPEPCNRCKSDKNVQRHHIDKNPANNVAENIEWLCASCHKKHHVAEKKAAEEIVYSSVTPAGVTIEYSPAPRRFYRVNGVECPSVTTILGVLDRSGPLTWWGMKVGVAGLLELFQKGHVSSDIHWDGFPDTDQVVSLLTEHKLTVNHVKDSAADRGVNVHGALEEWVTTKAIPVAENWSVHERDYVRGLCSFLQAVCLSAKDIQAELMVGSLEHSYAGRFDLVLTLSKPVEVVTRCYPKRPPKIETIPAGRYLLDLKTRKKANVYDSNYLQLEAYEAAAVECGYEPTDYRGVIVVTEDGKYQLSINRDWTFENFLAVRRCYGVMNERGVVQALRDELDAKEVA